MNKPEGGTSKRRNQRNKLSSSTRLTKVTGIRLNYPKERFAFKWN